jgi:hypothetical protein
LPSNEAGPGMNPWFRMYSDFIYDEAVEFLSFEDQRHFVFLLCLKNLGILDKEYAKEGMFDRVIAKKLGLSGEAFTSAKERLMDSGLITADWQPVNWDKRQFVTDSQSYQAKKQKKYRDSKRLHPALPPASPALPPSDGNCDRLDTDTETETETETEAKTDKSVTPLSRLLDSGVSKMIAEDYLEIRKVKKAPLTQTALDGLIREAHLARYEIKDALQICCERGWVGFKADWLASPSDSELPAAPWHSSDELTHAKARELGIPITDMRQLRIEINDAIQIKLHKNYIP